MELDNIKMWESLLRECDKSHDQPILNWIFNVRSALADQDLKYNTDTKKIEYIKQEHSELEVGKLYKCIKDCYTAVGAKILSDGKLYHCTAKNEVFGDGGSIWVGDLLCYFRPATPEEISHSDSDQEELTEFEKAILDIIPDHNTHTDSVEEFAKRNAKRLLSIARKQIVSEVNVDEMVQKFKDGVEEHPHGILTSLTSHGAYKLGMDDTLKAIKGE